MIPMYLSILSLFMAWGLPLVANPIDTKSDKSLSSDMLKAVRVEVIEKPFDTKYHQGWFDPSVAAQRKPKSTSLYSTKPTYRFQRYYLLGITIINENDQAVPLPHLSACAGWEALVTVITGDLKIVPSRLSIEPPHKGCDKAGSLRPGKTEWTILVGGDQGGTVTVRLNSLPPVSTSIFLK